MPAPDADRTLVADYAPRASSPSASVGVQRPASPRDADLAPPVEPTWGTDDTERRCGCDDSYTCRAHEAAAALSDADIERALEDLETRDSLTTHARDVLAGIGVLDCGSRRANVLLAALDDWDNAGLGEGKAGPRLSAREHELVYRKIGAALLDQVLADRRADPKLAADLAASVSPC